MGHRSTPPDDEAATTAIARLAATIAVAQGLAVSGRPIDLAGLDDAAGKLCAQLLDLPPDLGTALKPALWALHDKVDALATTLAERTR